MSRAWVPCVLQAAGIAGAEAQPLSQNVPERAIASQDLETPSEQGAQKSNGLIATDCGITHEQNVLSVWRCSRVALLVGFRKQSVYMGSLMWTSCRVMWHGGSSR
jgi:hypothetical protein